MPACSPVPRIDLSLLLKNKFGPLSRVFGFITFKRCLYLQYKQNCVSGVREVAKFSCTFSVRVTTVKCVIVRRSIIRTSRCEVRLHFQKRLKNEPPRFRHWWAVRELNSEKNWLIEDMFDHCGNRRCVNCCGTLNNLPENDYRFHVVQFFRINFIHNLFVCTLFLQGWFLR